MKIAGIQKLTLVDFPGKVAATVFTRGCSLRCGFCHNPELVIPEKFNPLISERTFFDFLESRLGKLQGVCITGGEPTIQADIISFISHIKALGFDIKLDTNGTRPEVLKQIIKNGDIDYIAMDVKLPLDKYPMVTNVKFQMINDKQNNFSLSPSQKNNPSNCHSELDSESIQMNYHIPPIRRAGKFEDNKQNFKKQHTTNDSLQTNIMQSIKLIMSSDIDYEFRTTAVKPLLGVDDFSEIGKMIKGAKRYFIQNFEKSKHIDEKMKYEPFSESELKKAKKTVKRYVQKAEIR